MRTIEINSAKLLGPAAPSWTPENPQGTISCDYIVGNVSDGVFIGYPAATVNGSASVPLDATHTAPQLYQALAGAILTAEGLDSSAGDTVLFS